MRILVVDDDAGIRDSLERALRREGYAVTTAADGEEALEAVAASAPDAIILDVSMPKLDGLRCAGGCGATVTACRSWC